MRLLNLIFCTYIFCSRANGRGETNDSRMHCSSSRPISNTSRTKMAPLDATSEQLEEFKNRWAKKPSLQTTGTGNPVSTMSASLTVGPRGPMLMEDFVFMDVQAHTNRERIPERVAHAKGAGAFGYFEVTHNITKYCKAVVFSEIGKQTRVVVRMSTSIGQSGSADTAREPRGFAVKHYTEDGTWDIVGFNSPMFFSRDPIEFTSIAHALRKNPVTHVRDANQIWDQITALPEMINFILFLYSDNGIPDGYRYMDGFSDNTFKLENDKGETFWCRFTHKSDQGLRNLSSDEATRIAGQDPDYSTRDLYNAIHRGEYPSWTLYIQVLTMEEAKTFPFNPFDSTKVWYDWLVPYIPVGKLVLNENPKNYFTDVEQSAFCPANMIPGIGPSPDKVLQGRIFAYSDAQRYRLGANHLQLPVNCPFDVRGFHNQQRDGFMAFYNKDGMPNYRPNSYYQPKLSSRARTSPYEIHATVDRYELGDDNNFEQPRYFWRKQLNEEERARLVENIASDLQGAEDFIQERAVKLFCQVDEEFCRRVSLALRKAN